jgi:hypothetical protein
MKARSVSGTTVHSGAMREYDAWTIVRASASEWLKKFAASYLMVFVQPSESDGRDDPVLGEQIRIPKEFLDHVDESPSSGIGKPR